MKAIVCVKQVPDTSGKVAVKADGTLDRASMATITNPDDLNALEAALKLKDATGCEVVVITMGPPPAEGMLRELLARVRANIRRRSLDLNARKSVGKLIEAKGLTIDPATFSVMRNGQAVDLTQKEYDLLLYLIQERGVVFSREDLMQKVWNYDYFGDMRTVDVTVRRLREKIEADPGKPQYILTKRGAGYYFAP